MIDWWCDDEPLAAQDRRRLQAEIALEKADVDAMKALT